VLYLPVTGEHRASPVVIEGAQWAEARSVALAHLRVVQWSERAASELAHWARPCLAPEDVDAPELDGLFVEVHDV
jgi:hypothetical protein